ncbi:hypothetical protein [Lentzea sp. NBRC 105346]|uniref:hypothetical protein n=1 Tax=Lentzea sp. NBRC 105346 TaxID=3032205 RepID=UPI0025532855|nr:hypothetical protein [Lentzea sp. NBRC 105346]
MHEDFDDAYTEALAIVARREADSSLTWEEQMRWRKRGLNLEPHCRGEGGLCPSCGEPWECGPAVGMVEEIQAADAE